MKKILIYLPLLLLSIPVMAQNVYLMDKASLLKLRTSAQQNDPATRPLLDSLRSQADQLLSMKPISVMDKTLTPASGDKHDYMSQAPYFWYDSTKPNGRPYLRRDGQRNPEINRITDHDYLGTLDHAVRVLALAWYLTGREMYAEKAASLIRYWFFDEATRMNPNLEYAQGIPGINNGRGIGIIETRSLTGIADAVGLLGSSQSWKRGDERAIQQWYGKYLHWMMTSKNGKDEHAAKNNHGVWFLVQAIDFSLFTGDAKGAQRLAQEAKAKIDSQVMADGRMPLELERTNALGYSTFNIEAWFDVATLAQQAGVDLWNYRNANGATLRTALEWLKPYALGEKKWTYQQIGHYNSNEIYPLLRHASQVYHDPSLMQGAVRKGRGDILDAVYQ